MMKIVELEKYYSFDRYTIEYSLYGGKGLMDTLRACKNSIRDIRIHEDADVGMASYGGSYTFDELDKNFDLNYPYFDMMFIHFKSDDTYLIYEAFEDKLTVKTRNPNFDLEAFLTEKCSD